MAWLFDLVPPDYRAHEVLRRYPVLLARFAGAALLSAAYVIAVYLAAWAITEATGHWSPDHLLGPALGLALGVAIIAALSLLASTVLSVTAQGIVVFMVFGAGLTAGLLAQTSAGHADEVREAVLDGALTSLAPRRTLRR